MKAPQNKAYIALDTDSSIWDHMFMVAPLVVVGTKEGGGYDMAPRHMAFQAGWGNFFGFVCTDSHKTYANIVKNKEFTVSFPLPEDVVIASLTATSREETTSKHESVIKGLPTVRATTVDALLLRDAYLMLECSLFKITGGFDGSSIITGKIKAAFVLKEQLLVSDSDEQAHIAKNPLLAYISPGRFAKITETYKFPFPKNFKV